jgi:hypothetical protein
MHKLQHGSGQIYTLNPKSTFFCGKILHLCKLKNAWMTPIKELIAMISSKNDH